MAATEFFDVSQPIDRDTFLSITREVLQASLLIMAPFGLPSELRQVERNEEMFVRKYGPRFRLVLESVSEKIYEARGVSESEVAVTLHKYTEEEKDEEALAIVGQMSEALRSVYSPPRILELPCVLPVSDLARIGLSMLRAGAIYAPGAGRPSENATWAKESPVSGTTQGVDCGAGASLTISPTNDTDWDADTPLCMACEARNALADYPRRMQEASENLKIHIGDAAASNRGSTSTGRSSTQSHGKPDHEKLRRARVASCLDMTTTLRSETEGFSEVIEQPHLQALTEVFRSRCTGRLVKDDGVCKCSAARDKPSSSEARHDAAMAALDEIAMVSFMDNDLLMMIRALEGQRQQKEGKAPVATGLEVTDDTDGPDGNTSQDPEAMLESLLTSQFYRMLAEQYLEGGSPHEAAKWYDEAYREGAALLPGRSAAELLAGWAQCYLRENDFEAASLKADAALSNDATCGEAFLVRGQCRRALGHDQGALGDLVKAFVLRGSALNGVTDNGEAQAIEEVSREACKAKAAEVFSVREMTNTLPADWMVRSYLASYNKEDMYVEKGAIRPPSEGQKSSTAESAFWQGISLMQNGRYAESEASFTQAIEAEDPKLQSLALERYASFQYLKKDMDGSLESLRRATVADPFNAKSWVKKGSVLSDLGRNDEALECFKAAQEINPSDPDLYLHRGQGYLLSNDFRKASKDLQKSVDLCPTVPISWAILGVALFKLGITDEQSSSSVEECLEVMEDALERFPENSEVLLFFAEVLVSMGDYARGLELLKRSAALDPECPLPYVNGARAYLGMNDLVAARRQGYNCGWHLERGQELDSTHSGTFMDMGQLLMQEGLPAEALSMYANGVETARFPSEIHDAMACLEVAKCHLEAQQLLTHPNFG
ncbi:unnamed protein product [Ascophyllum nodosum]